MTTTCIKDVIGNIAEIALTIEVQQKEEITQKTNMMTAVRTRGLNIEVAQDLRLWKFGRGRQQQMYNSMMAMDDMKN